MDCFDTQNAEETDSGKSFSLFSRFPKSLINSLIYMTPENASLDFGVFFLIDVQSVLEYFFYNIQHSIAFKFHTIALESQIKAL